MRPATRDAVVRQLNEAILLGQRLKVMLNGMGPRTLALVSPEAANRLKRLVGQVQRKLEAEAGRLEQLTPARTGCGLALGDEEESDL